MAPAPPKNGPKEAHEVEVEGEEEEESDEYDSEYDDEGQAGEDDDAKYENEDDEEEDSGADQDDDRGLTHLLLGNQQNDGVEENEEDSWFVPDGGVEPASEEVDGYARNPVPDSGPTGKISAIARTKRGREDRTEDAGEGEIASPKQDSKRVRA